jgi:hypothetical protein
MTEAMQEGLEVSKRERLERQIVIDPIPTLFVCALPHGSP